MKRPIAGEQHTVVPEKIDDSLRLYRSGLKCLSNAYKLDTEEQTTPSNITNERIFIFQNAQFFRQAMENGLCIFTQLFCFNDIENRHARRAGNRVAAK